MTQGNLCLQAERQLEFRALRAFKLMLHICIQAPTCCPRMGNIQMSSVLKVLSAKGTQTLSSVSANLLDTLTAKDHNVKEKKSIPKNPSLIYRGD